MVAERDLVTLALKREYKDKDSKPYTTTWFDMFRIANGKIVEHWDTAQKQ
jgi:predicted SnoaL-like aldol condensation-catalyzing enzyme